MKVDTELHSSELSWADVHKEVDRGHLPQHTLMVQNSLLGLWDKVRFKVPN